MRTVLPAFTRLTPIATALFAMQFGHAALAQEDTSTGSKRCLAAPPRLNVSFCSSTEICFVHFSVREA